MYPVFFTRRSDQEGFSICFPRRLASYCACRELGLPTGAFWCNFRTKAKVEVPSGGLELRNRPHSISAVTYCSDYRQDEVVNRPPGAPSSLFLFFYRFYSHCCYFPSQLIARGLSSVAFWTKAVVTGVLPSPRCIIFMQAFILLVRVFILGFSIPTSRRLASTLFAIWRLLCAFRESIFCTRKVSKPGMYEVWYIQHRPTEVVCALLAGVIKEVWYIILVVFQERFAATLRASGARKHGTWPN